MPTPAVLLWFRRDLRLVDNPAFVAAAGAWAVLPVCYFFTDPRRALNGVFGPSGEHAQTWMAPGWYFLLMMAFYPACVFLPSHLVLRKIFRDQPAPSAR